ncbi:MAG TPA: UDP-3-O-acyl-N-acetylglucosamine deacetylase [Candidatus Binatia bacterium]|jgi:UDP-3-O-acyl N-acetylglucosamine deacetylase|nr:UDP-3-O-acyl-N-acetylglucosamine deacetylase [Candidatus Binatia bacterium]
MTETILVVDDEEKIRQTLRGVLSDEGFDVVEAANGRAALDAISAQVPRLAIVDIWMPEMDGIELVQRMRAQAPALPIIVISGHGTIETAVKVIRLGAFDFLEKPFQLDALLRVVGRALGDVTIAPETNGIVSIDTNGTTAIAPPRRLRQRTIGRSVVVNGQGLHSGVRTGLILQPLPPGSGILFGSITSGETVPALVDHVDSTGYATTLVRGGMVAKTIEHLMAALHAHAVTNLLVKMQGEVPILDGSASDLCALIAEGGVVEQDDTIEELAVDKRYAVGSDEPDGKGISIEPSDVFEVQYTLEYPAPIGRQQYDFRLTDPEAFCREIAPARTFGFVKEIATLEQMGLAAGGRLNNFILVGDEGVVNAPLRFADEFVRHKILDIFGDFYLLGRPIRGRIVARRTGHSDNAALLRVLRERFGLPSFRGA